MPRSHPSARSGTGSGRDCRTATGDVTDGGTQPSPGRRRVLSAGASVLLAGTLAAPGLARAAVDPAQVPEPKRTKSGQYLNAADVPAFIGQHGGASKVLFLDVRTRAEAMFVGMPDAVDALVPFVELQEMMTDWDEQRHSYRLEPLQDFVPAVRRRLQQKSLGPDATVVLICRSGDRSGRAANRLGELGFANVWSVVDGFEGDLSRDGRRTVNGWKNAGLPWSYRLERSKMYFPAS